MYTCPMHPTVVSDEPGECPICGMELVPMTTSGDSTTIGDDLSRLVESPNEAVVGSIKTIYPEVKSITPTVRTQGIVTYDTRNIYTIPARVGGRLEKVYLKYVFQPVKKGQRIAEIYSPELITAQRELLYLLENDPGNNALIESARTKLSLLGASRGQIESLMKRKEVQNTFTVYSPYSGYLIKEDASAPAIPAVPTGGTTQSNAMGSMASGMGSSPSQTTTPSMANSLGTLIREGDYVSTGQTLFKVISPSSLRIELKLPVSESGPIKAGDHVELDFGSGKTRNAQVEFVQPFFGENEEFVNARIYLKDMQDLQVGQLVNASISFRAVESLWVSRNAVLDLGLDHVVFLKEGELLKPKKITTGARAGDLIEIKRGLSSSDEIAANAHYLVDSQSFIQVSN